MEVDPMEYVEDKDAAKELLAEERRDSRLNSWVAISVALLATFVAICTVSERGLVKDMQYELTQSLDNWQFYQARNIRGVVAQTAADQFAIESQTSSGAAKALFAKKAAQYKKMADEQNAMKKEQKAAAQKADAAYETLKKRDEHFELSEAVLAIAVSMLALTSLTHKKWLFFFAMIPTALGMFLGIAGLAHPRLPLDSLSRLLK